VEQEDGLYLILDKRISNLLDNSYATTSREELGVVEIECENIWNQEKNGHPNHSLSIYRRLQLGNNTSLRWNNDEIWIWNESPRLLVEKLVKTWPAIPESLWIESDRKVSYSVLVDTTTNEGNLRWIHPTTTLQMNNASQYVVEGGLIVQALAVHQYPKHWNMFYSQSMKDMSLWDAQIAYIYRQLITNYGHNAMNRSEESDYLANICHQEFVRFKPDRYPIEDRFTVLLSTFHREALVVRLVQHYQENPLVHRIFVLWHNPDTKPSEQLWNVLEENKSFVLWMPFDSLNNRFLPLEGIETKAVLICDDDMFVHHEDIAYAFQIWNHSRDSLVGFFPRAHKKMEDNEYEYLTHIPMDGGHNRYSIMLTKIEFMKSEYLFWYSCAFDRRVLQWIREHKNCEDIAMQMVSYF